ncbi:MAG: DnaJ domain-containing protein [Pseudomonadota bacterium]
MTTLYDLLGLSKNATEDQVKHAFILQSEQIAATTTPSEEGRNQLIAVREAYAILSSPSRRQAYDRKLAGIPAAPDVPEPARTPLWVVGLIAALIVGGGAYAYQAQAKRTAAQREAMELARTQAEAEQAQQQAQAEEAKLERERLAQAQRDQESRRREAESARYEGNQVHRSLEYQAERDAQQKEQAARMAKNDAQREEAAARRRVYEQQQAMQRALALRVHDN